LMNGEKYNSLSDEAKAIIDKHSGEALSRAFGDVHFDIQGKRLETTMANSEHTIVIPSEEDAARWDEVMNGVVEEWVGTHSKGQELYSALQEELESLRSE